MHACQKQGWQAKNISQRARYPDICVHSCRSLRVAICEGLLVDDLVYLGLYLYKQTLVCKGRGEVGRHSHVGEVGEEGTASGLELSNCLHSGPERYEQEEVHVGERVESYYLYV